MYTIGEISKIANISANTLRYYDEIALIKPRLVNDSNQYRYYSRDQIREITFVMELKQYGFTLEEIKYIMENNDDEKLKNMLEKKLNDVDKNIEKLKEKSSILKKRIYDIEKEETSCMCKGRVLIVDDLELGRIIIKDIIEEYGYKVVGQASNGEEGIIAFEELRPDIVIMDIVMPKMDGIDATKKITEKYKDAKIIMCSSIKNEEVILESVKNGAIDFISKPISTVSLISALERGLKGSYKFHLSEDENENKNIEKSRELDKKTLATLREGFDKFSKLLSKDIASNLQNQCIIKLLRVEIITKAEFETLPQNIFNKKVVNYESKDLLVYTQIYEQSAKGQVVIGTLKNIIQEKINYFIEIIKMKNSYEFNYGEITLISFNIEINKESIIAVMGISKV